MKIFHTLCVLSIVLSSGCSTTNNRIVENQSQFNSYTAAEKRLIRSGEIAVGFDEDQVRMALGDPSHIKSDTRSSGTRYIWEYNELEPDYNIFNSVGVSTRGGGVGAVRDKYSKTHIYKLKKSPCRIRKKTGGCKARQHVNLVVALFVFTPFRGDPQQNKI